MSRDLYAGLRFDHYSLVVEESAWSPRLAVSRFFSSFDLENVVKMTFPKGAALKDPFKKPCRLHGH
jgi:hypothetical protein